ncbi:MAG: efflux transporter outer membrane subunit [Phycisphaerales bacterium]|nr:efflux transporter outer membrane subunit [Phycisphaerales bacterium]
MRIFKHIPLFATMALIVLVGGCAVGPDYHRPDLGLEADYGYSQARAATQPSGVTTQPARLAQWWTTLNDPLLDDLIEQAVRDGLDGRLAEARVREARARRAAAGAGQFPAFDARGGYSRIRNSQNAAPFNAFDLPGFPWEFDLYQAGFDASWELDVFGGVRRTVEAAGADLSAAVEDHRAVLLSLMAEVARNYVELRGAQRQLDIARQNLLVQRQTLDLTRNQVRNGIGTQLDVSRARALVSTTEAQIPALERVQWQTIHRLAVLVGKQPEALADLLVKPAPIPVPPAQVSIGLPVDLLRRRPDIRRAESRLAAATARIGAATADLYPRFSLTGSFVMQSEEPRAIFDWRSRGFNVGPSISWPILDFGRLRAVVDVRGAQQEQALVQYEQTVLRALEEVHDALVAYATEQSRHRSLNDAAEANQQSVEMARQLYRQGLTDFMTILDAQRSLYQSQWELAQSDQMLTTSLVGLYKALGGGWDVEPVRTQTPTGQAAATR